MSDIKPVPEAYSASRPVGGSLFGRFPFDPSLTFQSFLGAVNCGLGMEPFLQTGGASLDAQAQVNQSHTTMIGFICPIPPWEEENG